MRLIYEASLARFSSGDASVELQDEFLLYFLLGVTKTEETSINTVVRKVADGASENASSLHVALPRLVCAIDL